jgi:AraC-like DNA-binding protein
MREAKTLLRRDWSEGIGSLVSYPGDVLEEAHDHRSPHFAIVVTGEVLEVSAGFPRRLSCGDVTLHTLASTHTLYFKNPALVATLETDLDADWPDAVSGVRFDLRVLQRKRALSQYAHFLRQRCAQPPPRVSQWLRRSVATFAWMEDVSLASAAREAGVSHSYYDREFRKTFGCTPCEYRRLVRLRHAARLLQSTSDRVSDVAAESGFAHQSHFTDSFVHQYGVTPKHFRALFGSNSR